MVIGTSFIVPSKNILSEASLREVRVELLMGRRKTYFENKSEFHQILADA